MVAKLGVINRELGAKLANHLVEHEPIIAHFLFGCTFGYYDIKMKKCMFGLFGF